MITQEYVDNLLDEVEKDFPKGEADRPKITVINHKDASGFEYDPEVFPENWIFILNDYRNEMRGSHEYNTRVRK